MRISEKMQTVKKYSDKGALSAINTATGGIFRNDFMYGQKCYKKGVDWLYESNNCEKENRSIRRNFSHMYCMLYAFHCTEYCFAADYEKFSGDYSYRAMDERYIFSCYGDFGFGHSISDTEV